MIVTFFILIILLTFFKTGKGILSIERSNALKAFFPYIIILHHVSQATGGVLDFRWAGPYGVGVFFFLSGYGLEYKRSYGLLNLYSYISRIKRILFPIILPAIIYLLLLSYDGINIWKYTIEQLQHPAIVFPYTWFVITLLILYTSYYIVSYLLTKSRFIAELLLLYSVIMVLLRMDGTFFITTYCFLAGAIYHNKESLVQKWQTQSRVVSFVILVLFITTIVALFPPPFKGYAALGALIWTICFIFLFTKINVRYNNILDHLKNISYDVFLCQGIAFYVLSKCCLLETVWLYASLSILLSLLLGEICFSVRKLMKI